MKQYPIFSMIRAEFYKTKSNIGLIAMLLFPVVVTIVVTLYMTYDYFNALGESEVFAYNPWSILLGRHTFSFYSFLYPIITAIFCYSLCDMEYKNNSFRQLFLLPVNRDIILSSKIILILGVSFLSVLIALLMFFLAGYSMSFLLPRYNFQDYEVWLLISPFFFKTLLAIFAVSMIQYFLSLVFKNFVIPVGICSFGVVLP